MLSQCLDIKDSARDVGPTLRRVFRDLFLGYLLQTICVVNHRVGLQQVSDIRETRVEVGLVGFGNFSVRRVQSIDFRNG